MPTDALNWQLYPQLKVTYVVRCHRKLSFLTKGELGDPLVPPFDHVTDADLRDKRDIPVSAGIELLSVGECSHIMDCDEITAFGKVRAIAG